MGAGCGDREVKMSIDKLVSGGYKITTSCSRCHALVIFETNDERYENADFSAYLCATCSKPEAVDHPQHYGGADNVYEVIKVLEAWDLNFHLGNTVKYIARAGKKTENRIEDLKKAKWYLEREIARLEKL